MPITDEVKEQRRLGIAATDAAPILGLSPWKTPSEVWIEKKHPELVDRKESKAIYWGNRLEQIVADEYALQTGQDLDESQMLRNPKIPWIMCNPDRIVRGKKKGVECKTSSDRNAHQWGPAGSDRVPPYYLAQVMHSMMVTNIPEWDLAVLIGGSDFRIYHIFRDKEMMRAMYAQEEEFYNRFIAGSETPTFDWGKGLASYVKNKYPKAETANEFSVDRNGDGTLKKALLDLLKARSEKASSKKIEDTQKTLIQAYMRTSEEMKWDDHNVRITWKNIKESVKIDWKKLIEEILPHVTLHADEKKKIFDRHTKVTPGARRFVVYDDNDEGEDE